MDRRMVRPVIKNIIGIDCGVNGGIAFKSNDVAYGLSVKAVNMPDTIEKLRSQLVHYKNIGNCIAYIEDVPPFVGFNRPAARIFKLAKNYGEVLGVLTGLNIDCIKVRPAVWMKAIGTNKKKHYKTDNEWKNYLKKLAMIYWPNTKVTLKTADALLILQYGDRQQLLRDNERIANGEKKK